MIKSDNFGDVRPQFCFVRPRWCLSRTYVLSGEKNYLQPCCRMKWQGTMLSTPFWMECLFLAGLALSMKFTSTHLYWYTWVDWRTVRVKCLAQEHDTMSKAAAWTQTNLSKVQRTNHLGTANPPSLKQVTETCTYSPINNSRIFKCHKSYSQTLQLLSLRISLCFTILFFLSEIFNAINVTGTTALATRW